jgi:putative acetyltransferase
MKDDLNAELVWCGGSIHDHAQNFRNLNSLAVSCHITPMSSHIFRIQTPDSPDRLAAVGELFATYAASLNIDLCFQNFDAELAGLPGDYAPPRGALLTAYAGAQLAGCCAMRPLDTVDYPNACEIKRLFVLPPFRGHGAGRILAEATLDAARQANYTYALLDTLSEMESARSLYEELGFTEIPPYYFNPIEGAHYLMVRL